MRGELLVGAVLGGVVLAAATARDTRACGGCFVRPTSQNATVVTDHRMIFSLSPTQTTLYDQIRYSGSPSDFAWVLPIHGQVGLGVSSDLLFTVLDQQTQTTILAPPYPCPACNCGFANASLGADAPSASGSSSGGGSGGVSVIAQEVVGPYATVQLHPTSTSDTMAVTSWLDANGYTIPSAVSPIIAAYVQEGFDFLAIKLVPGQGVQAMRPISVTSMGAGLSLPLRMVAAGTGSTVGITLWVVASGRYEPQNFTSFTIDPSSLVWDWSASSSNYTTLRADKEQSYSNAAWQIESSLDVAPYAIENSVLQDPQASAYAAVPAADGGVGQTAIEVRTQDLNTLFPQGGSSARITRMRGDLSQAALANDLILQAAADQSSLSNVYQAKLSVNANCPVCSCGSVGGGGIGANNGFPFGGGGFGGGVGSSGSIPGGTGVGAGGSSSGSGSSGASHSGCSASPSDASGAGVLGALAGLVGLAIYRARSRKRH